MDLEAVRLELSKSLEPIECGGNLNAGLGQVFAHLLCGIRDVRYPVQVDLVARLLGKVDDIVQAGGEHQYVLLVNWSHECTVDQVMNLMRRLVALVLKIAQSRVPAFALQQRLAQLGQRLADQLSLGPEQVVEAAARCDWREFHCILRRKVMASLVKASLTRLYHSGSD